jgi:hypothetical protein
MMRNLAAMGFCAFILLSGTAVSASARGGGASHGGHAAAASTTTGHGVPNGFVYDRTAPPGTRCQPGVCFNP